MNKTDHRSSLGLLWILPLLPVLIASRVAGEEPILTAGHYYADHQDEAYGTQHGYEEYDFADDPRDKKPDSIHYYGPGRSWQYWESTGLNHQKTWVTGRDTWWFFTGGSEHFYRALSRRLGKLDVSVDFFRLLDTRNREQRFSKLGLINEPNFKQADEPDEYGLWLDVPEETHPDQPNWKADGRLPPDPYYPRDEEAYGLPTGIIGFRLFRNPRFTKSMDENWKNEWKKWWAESEKGSKIPEDAKTTNPVAKFFANPGTVEPPYISGITCAFCHVAFDPTNPPVDPIHPKWKNLSANIGNQYLREGDLFFGDGRLTGGDANPVLDNPDPKKNFQLDPYQTRGLGKDNFLYQYGHSQQSGTSETSRFSYDFINNPNTINQLFFVGQRPHFVEESPDGRKIETLHVLKDGADSVGIPAALSRVYVNIGAEAEYWLSRLWNPLEGSGPNPFSIAEVMLDVSVPEWRKQELKETVPGIGRDWRRVIERMPALATYLMSYNSPFTLEDAVNRAVSKVGDEEEKLKLKALLPDADRVRHGASVFASYCAKCHSNKQPTYPLRENDYAVFYKQSVTADDFRDGNTLTNDKRIPLTVIGTNSQRAFATNAIDGEIWAEFSSRDYKALPPIGTLQFVTPLNLISSEFGNSPLKTTFVAPGGGRGYYRTASLVSLWATAPYLHNNSLGTDPYNKPMETDPDLEDPDGLFDPAHGFASDVFTVSQRMRLFDDGIRTLLGLKPRDGIRTVKLATKDSTLFGGLERTKYRVKAEAIWTLIGPKLEETLIEQIKSKIGKDGEDKEALNKIVEVAVKEALVQARAQLPRLLEQKDLSQLKQSLKPLILPLVRTYIVQKAQVRLEKALSSWPDVPPSLVDELMHALENVDLTGIFASGVGGPASLFEVEVPKGTPLNLVLNQNIKNAPYVVQSLSRYRNEKRLLAEELLKLSDCPDIVEDHGHQFPTPEERKRDGVSSDDLEDLIEFLKTL